MANLLTLSGWYQKESEFHCDALGFREAAVVCFIPSAGHMTVNVYRIGTSVNYKFRQ